jgi:hypothetical protein
MKSRGWLSSLIGCNSSVIESRLTSDENHAGLLFPLLEDVPGTYQTDMDLLCSGKDACLGGDWFQRDGNAGEAVVSAVSTPEPGTLALVGVGLIGLLARKRKAHRTPIAAQTQT